MDKKAVEPTTCKFKYPVTNGSLFLSPQTQSVIQLGDQATLPTALHYLTTDFFFLFGPRPRRGRWPMLSHRGNFSFFFYVPPPGSNPSLEAQIPASKLKSQPWGSNPSLEAQIPALRLKSQPWGSNPSLEPQIAVSRLKSQSRGSNPNLEAQIPALRLKSQPWSLNPSLEA